MSAQDAHAVLQQSDQNPEHIINKKWTVLRLAELNSWRDECRCVKQAIELLTNICTANEDEQEEEAPVSACTYGHTPT